jgi:hypothetical protein
MEDISWTSPRKMPRKKKKATTAMKNMSSGFMEFTPVYQLEGHKSCS